MKKDILENINIDKAILENIDMAILENIDIDIHMDIRENIDIDIDKDILDTNNHFQQILEFASLMKYRCQLSMYWHYLKYQ